MRSSRSDWHSKPSNGNAPGAGSGPSGISPSTRKSDASSGDESAASTGGVPARWKKCTSGGAGNGRKRGDGIDGVSPSAGDKSTEGKKADSDIGKATADDPDASGGRRVSAALQSDGRAGRSAERRRSSSSSTLSSKNDPEGTGASAGGGDDDENASGDPGRRSLEGNRDDKRNGSERDHGDGRKATRGDSTGGEKPDSDGLRASDKQYTEKGRSGDGRSGDNTEKSAVAADAAAADKGSVADGTKGTPVAGSSSGIASGSTKSSAVTPGSDAVAMTGTALSGSSTAVMASMMGDSGTPVSAEGSSPKPGGTASTAVSASGEDPLLIVTPAKTRSRDKITKSRSPAHGWEKSTAAVSPPGSVLPAPEGVSPATEETVDPENGIDGEGRDRKSPAAAAAAATAGGETATTPAEKLARVGFRLQASPAGFPSTCRGGSSPQGNNSSVSNPESNAGGKNKSVATDISKTADKDNEGSKLSREEIDDVAGVSSAGIEGVTTDASLSSGGDGDGASKGGTEGGKRASDSPSGGGNKRKAANDAERQDDEKRERSGVAGSGGSGGPTSSRTRYRSSSGDDLGSGPRPNRRIGR